MAQFCREDGKKNNFETITYPLSILPAIIPTAAHKKLIVKAIFRDWKRLQ